MRETQVQPLGREDLLEKKMATHSHTLAWKTPWMEEPGRLQSMESQESDTTERLHFPLAVERGGERVKVPAVLKRLVLDSELWGEVRAGGVPPPGLLM